MCIRDSNHFVEILIISGGVWVSTYASEPVDVDVAVKVNINTKAHNHPSSEVHIPKEVPTYLLQINTIPKETPIKRILPVHYTRKIFYATHKGSQQAS